MRRMLPFVICIFLAANSNAQSSYASVKLEQTTDYKKAEVQVLQAGNLLLSTPFDKDNLDRLYAIQFIMKWMEGTPDYSFNLESSYAQAFFNDPDIFGLYLAALVRLTVENRNGMKDPARLPLDAAKRVLQYAGISGNNLKLQGELKKMNTAYKKGELEKFFATAK